jgi:hypothetical protein
MNKSRLGPILLAMGIPLLVIGLFFFAAGSVFAAPVQVNLEQCANGGSNETNQCSTDPGGSIGWVNGNSNSQKSTYQIGQFVAYRFVFDNLTAGATYCGAFAWDVSEGGKPAVDYVSTFSNTMTLADPTLGTTFAGQVNAPSYKIPIPPDPALGVLMDGQVFTGTQRAGTINLWGAALVNKPAPWPASGLIYANTGQFGDLASGGSAGAQSLEYCFTPVGSQVLMALGGHIADPSTWGNLARPSGSPYHMRYGSNAVFTAPRTSINDLSEELGEGVVNHYNFGNIEVQLDVAEPTAITLQNISASGGSAATGLVIAVAGLLAIGTGLILVLRKRQPIES